MQQAANTVHCRTGILPRSKEPALPDQKQLLVISAIGDNRSDTLHGLARLVRDCGCNLEESRMTMLGADFAALLLVSGNWSAIARLETSLPRLEENHGLKINRHRCEPRATRDDLIPYAVDVVSIDQPGIVHSLAEFFSAHEIGIAEMSTRTYAASHTGAPMFSLQMAVNVPTSLHIGVLRDDFMDFCDQMNLDAVLEPIKN